MCNVFNLYVMAHSETHEQNNERATINIVRLGAPVPVDHPSNTWFRKRQPCNINTIALKIVLCTVGMSWWRRLELVRVNRPEVPSEGAILPNK